MSMRCPTCGAEPLGLPAALEEQFREACRQQRERFERRKAASQKFWGPGQQWPLNLPDANVRTGEIDRALETIPDTEVVAARSVEHWSCLGCKTTLDSRDEGCPCWKCGRVDWKPACLHDLASVSFLGVPEGGEAPAKCKQCGAAVDARGYGDITPTSYGYELRLKGA